MNKRLRKLLFSAALLALPFTSMKAFEWSAYGTELNIFGYATSGGYYLDGDRIWDTYETVNSSFQATDEDYTLDIYSMLYDEVSGDPIAPCSLKIDGDVILDATLHDMIVNVNADNDQTFETVIHPFIEDYAVTPIDAIPELGYSQVVFQTDVGTKITVNLQQDLVFSGSDDLGYPADMIVTFKGAGQTVFKMYDGTAIKFDGEIDYSGGIAIVDEDGATEWYGVSAEAGKTRVYITMDQTAAEVSAGNHKVLFERANISADETSHPEYRVMVYVGFNSFITYLSDNATGIDAGSDRMHASIGFDPSNVGTGRMVLFLKGAYSTGWEVGLDPEEFPNMYWWIVDKYPMNDAAVVVAGHYVDSFDPANISHPDKTQVGVDFSTPAGGFARFDILDAQYYNSQDVKPFAYNVDDSRGLLVVNDVQNHGKLASDPYWDFWNTEDYEGPYWSYFQDPENPLHAFDLNVRRGFVVGVNGRIGIEDNAFLDYTAGSINQPDAIAWYGLADEEDPTEYTPDFDHGVLKFRNPSALIVDNIDAALFYTDEAEPTPWCEFSAGNPFLHNPYYNNGVDAVHAQIQLFGHARAYFKDSASSYDGTRYGYIYNFWNLEEAGGDPINDIELDWDVALSVGEPDELGDIEKSTYDGYQLSSNLHTLSEGEGEHVLDVEGKLSTHSFVNTAIPGRSTGYSPAVRAGTIAMSSVLKDYTGQEINDGVYFNRPLLTYYLGGDDATYVRYNSPAFFFNATAQLFETVLRHDDATKYVAGIPYDADPAYTGGEVLFFTNEMWPGSDVTAPERYMLPELRYFNSTFESHESACMTGLRNIVKDIPGIKGPLGNNMSVVKFFDHGDALDSLLTKHGRILQFSSMWCLMGDGNSNYATESAPVNVYKGNKPVYRLDSDVEDTSATIKLSLQREGEYPTVPFGHDYSKEIAHNLFLVSIPDALGARCGLNIGWTPNIYPEDGLKTQDLAVPADLRMMPLAEQGGYPYETLPLYDEAGAYLFALNALDEHYPAAPAVVSIDGDLITFGGFDQYGNSAKTPVTDYFNNGVIQVIHGGKMMITRPESDVLPFDRTSVPYQTFIDTMVVKTIWNDWNLEGTEREVWFGGVFNVPHDQVTFGKTFGVQPYGITSDMFESRYEETGGYVRVDFNNEDRALRADKTGDEEVVFGWFQRDANPKLSQTKGTLVRRIDASSKLTQELKKFLTRATESVDTPVDRPDYLLYIAAPDDITQMRVSGATMADPFHLDIVGNFDEAGIPSSARVREFTTQYSTNGLVTQHFIGEGAHAVLFGEYGGVIGLGDRHWNENSLNAWNLLGKDYVSIAPLGDMTVELNSNLIVTDRLPLIATTSFGAGDKAERLTFYSALPLEIRIPAGFELDLSAFGQSVQRQEIEFAGNVRLVLEDGAKIRFPAPEKVVGGVVLYFNDDSQFVFEGLEIPGTYTDGSDTNYDLIKIMGKGQIWLNKNAKMLVNGDVRVGVQSDELTPNTDVTISIQRQGAMFIGDETLAGGTFQVGNPVAVEGGTINFSLVLNGAKALFETNREGFFGLGAGILNKNAGEPMNGSAISSENPMIDEITGKAEIVDGYPVFTRADDSWSVIPLYNVNEVKIEVAEGAIQHNNIFDGSSANAAMWAIGNANKYTLNLNNSERAIIRGGGNIMMLPAVLPEGAEYFNISMWDYAGELNTQESYSILDSAPTMLTRSFAGSTKSDFLSGYSFEFNTLLGGDNASVGFYNLVSFQSFLAKTTKQVCISRTLFEVLIGFVNKDVNTTLYRNTDFRIFRDNAPADITGNIEQGLNFGAIDGRGDSANPIIFTANWPVY